MDGRKQVPNRELREGIKSSGVINDLSDRGFRVYINVISSADDFGLLEWSPTWVKAEALPLLAWTLAEVSEAMADVAAKKAVRLYESAGKQYAAVEKWEQRRWAKKPKCPEPPWGLEAGDGKSHILGGWVAPRAREGGTPARRGTSSVNGWDRTNDGILAKAKELGISTRGESTENLKRLCFAELGRRKEP